MNENNKELLEAYTGIIGLKESFKDKIEPVICMLLDKSSIKLCPLASRVKDKISFIDKVDRKQSSGKPYTDALKEMHDIVGFRIVTYYNRDIQKVSDLIEKNFNIQEIENKKEYIATNEFGYLDVKIVAKISDELALDDSFCAFKDYTFEIQIRTVLQDAWSVLSHEIGYKKRKNLPPEHERTLNALSATLEIIDNKISELRYNLQEMSTEEYFSSEIQSQPVTIDILREYLEQSESIREIEEYSKGIQFQLANHTRTSYLEAIQEELSLNNAVSITQIDAFFKTNIDMLCAAVNAWKNASQRKHHAKDAIIYASILLITKSESQLKAITSGWGSPWDKYTLNAFTMLNK